MGRGPRYKRCHASQTRKVQHSDGQHREEGHAGDSVDEGAILNVGQRILGVGVNDFKDERRRACVIYRRDDDRPRPTTDKVSYRSCVGPLL